VSVGIIVLVLMQQGKGADAGAAFGSGASGTVFGSRGSANFLSRTTAVLATVFFLNSIGLAFLASGRTVKSISIMDSAAPVASQPAAAPTAPVGDVPLAPGDAAPAANVQSGDVPLVPDVKTQGKQEEQASPEEKKPAKDEKQVQEKK
jgi:preprotein translocase subunit SecG